jgi:hypothetical protein
MVAYNTSRVGPSIHELTGHPVSG